MKTKKIITIGLAAILFSILATLAPPSAEAQWDPLEGWNDPGVTMASPLSDRVDECLRIKGEQQFLLDITPVPDGWGIVFIPGASVASVGMLGTFEIALIVSDWDELDCKNTLASVGV